MLSPCFPCVVRLQTSNGFLDRLDEKEDINSTSQDDDEDLVEFMVLDFVDAFWQIPLYHDEPRYFVSRLKSEYFVFRRTAQGSRNGPFSWACVVAHAQRLAQSPFILPTNSDRGV